MNLQLPLGPERSAGRGLPLQEPRTRAQICGGLRLPAAWFPLPRRRRHHGHHPAPRRAVPGWRGATHPHQAAQGRPHRHHDRPPGQSVLIHGHSGVNPGAQEVQETRRRTLHQRRRALRERQTTEPPTPEHIDKIVDTYQYRKEEERYARRVDMDEIEKNDYNLNISRYVSTSEAEPEIDLAAVHKCRVPGDRQAVQSHHRYTVFWPMSRSGSNPSRTASRFAMPSTRARCSISSGRRTTSASAYGPP